MQISATVRNSTIKEIKKIAKQQKRSFSQMVDLSLTLWAAEYNMREEKPLYPQDQIKSSINNSNKK